MYGTVLARYLAHACWPVEAKPCHCCREPGLHEVVDISAPDSSNRQTELVRLGPATDLDVTHIFAFMIPNRNTQSPSITLHETALLSKS